MQREAIASATLTFLAEDQRAARTLSGAHRHGSGRSPESAGSRNTLRVLDYLLGDTVAFAGVYRGKGVPPQNLARLGSARRIHHEIEAPSTNTIAGVRTDRTVTVWPIGVDFAGTKIEGSFSHGGAARAACASRRPRRLRRDHSPSPASCALSDLGRRHRHGRRRHAGLAVAGNGTVPELQLDVARRARARPRSGDRARAHRCSLQRRNCFALSEATDGTARYTHRFSA